MDDIYLFLAIIMAGLAGLLLLVSSASWYRLRALKLGLVSIAFLVLFIKAVLLIFEIIIQDKLAVLIDVIVLVILYFSVVKR